MKNGPFVLFVLAITFIYFILTGIQFWVTDYLITTLDMDEGSVHIAFGLISITGPIFGVIIGGNVTSYLGGFREKWALITTLLMSVLCLLTSAPAPFTTNSTAFLTLLWFLLFFGGYMMPSLSGMMLETIPVDLKTTGNSIANISYNLLGFLPAPGVYGFVYDYGLGGNATEAMATLMFTPIISMVCIAIAAILIFKNDTFGYKSK